MAKASDKAIVKHGAASDNPSYLEWGPVWAGAIAAVAISSILIQFGAATGLAAANPIRADNTISYNFIAVSLWLILVSVGSSASSGYIAGRMRKTMNDSTENEVEFRDGIHGLTAWALSTVIVVAITSIAATLLSGAAIAQPEPIAEIPADLELFASNQSIVLAFATAAGSALGAAAAWAASVAGGKHRNDGTSYNVVVPAAFRKR